MFAREDSDETAIERYNREKEHVNLGVGCQSDPARPDTPSRIAQQGIQNDRNLRSSPPHPPNAQHPHGVRAARSQDQYPSGNVSDADASAELEPSARTTPQFKQGAPSTRISVGPQGRQINVAAALLKDTGLVQFVLSRDNFSINFIGPSHYPYAVVRSNVELKGLKPNHGKMIVYAMKQETDEGAISRHIRNAKNAKVQQPPPDRIGFVPDVDGVGVRFQEASPSSRINGQSTPLQARRITRSPGVVRDNIKAASSAMKISARPTLSSAVVAR